MSGASTATTYVDTRNYLSFVSPYAEGAGTDHLTETLRKESQQSGRESVIGDRVEAAMKTKLAETNAFKLRLEAQLAQTNHELSLREESLRRLEDELEAKRAPLAINKECTARRAERPGREDIHDEVMALLEGEMKMLSEHVAALETRVNDSRTEVDELRQLKKQIEDDVEDKRRGLEIDAQCLRLRQEARALMTR